MKRVLLILALEVWIPANVARTTKNGESIFADLPGKSSKSEANPFNDSPTCTDQPAGRCSSAFRTDRSSSACASLRAAYTSRLHVGL
jgi:hypothetical protein